MCLFLFHQLHFDCFGNPIKVGSNLRYLSESILTAHSVSGRGDVSFLARSIFKFCGI